MKWCELKVEVNDFAREAVVEILRKEKAEGVVIDDSKESRVELTAFFPENSVPSGLYDKISHLKKFNLSPGEIIIKRKLIKDEDWMYSWQEYIQPVEVAEQFVICPDWPDCSDSEYTEIKIKPGMAFGTGSHESTGLALELLVNHAGPERKNMLDAGCGTGILSIAAAKMGQENIVALDVSEAAVRSSRENIKLNTVENIIEVKNKDISEVYGEYSIVIANLLPVLMKKLLPHLVERVGQDGVLILSGLIQKEYKPVVSRVNDLGLKIIESAYWGDWSALVAEGG